MVDTQIAQGFVVHKDELTQFAKNEAYARLIKLKNQIENQEGQLFDELRKLIDKRWVFFDNKKVIYDDKINVLYPDTSHFNCHQQYARDLHLIPNGKLRFEGFQGYLPSDDEVKAVFYKESSGHPLLTKERLQFKSGEYTDWVGYKNGSQLYCMRVHDGHFSYEYSSTAIVPFYKIKLKEKSEVIAWWMKKKLIPKGLSEQAKQLYVQLMEFEFLQFENNHLQFLLDDVYSLLLNGSKIDLLAQSIQLNALISQYEQQELALSTEEIYERLLNCEKTRADIEPYDEKVLTDPNRGHWDLWSFKRGEQFMELALQDEFVMRDPRSSIKEDGIIGIDFGTKSTVVVHQESHDFTLPMRIGVGSLSQEVKPHHYENPTIMEFVNLDTFLTDYYMQAGRPPTKWADVRVSHTALNSLKDTLRSDQYYTVISDLKQWAGDKKRQIRLKDQQGHEIVLPSFLDLSEDSVNPIELYAYYLGLYINNMHNGIYLDYTLSFPVTYEKEVREKIIESFAAGLKKSLPIPLLEDEDVMARFRVEAGASEPEAYAVCAMQAYQFKPEEDEKYFYGVFDFGGGTTDFDFGIWRGATRKERRYDFVIEHFGAGGDKFLGGENLLELIAFELLKENQQLLREEEIVFTLPSECQKFVGSEVLLNESQEAKLNMKLVMESLRPLWERHEGYEALYERGIIRKSLYAKDGTVKENLELAINIERLEEVLEARIDKGVRNFFESLKQAYQHELVGSIDDIQVLLCGNSSKSHIVRKLFDQYIYGGSLPAAIELLEPLGMKVDLDDESTFTAPNAKTGVAFGLVQSRKGGKIKVVDHNKVEDEVQFKYYLGENRRGHFSLIVDRNNSYNKWFEFIDASELDFEVYYTSLPEVKSRKVEINEIPRKKLRIDETSDEANVYIRTVGPTTIEYVVATEEGILQGEYVGEIKKVEL